VPAARRHSATSPADGCGAEAEVARCHGAAVADSPWHRWRLGDRETAAQWPTARRWRRRLNQQQGKAGAIGLPPAGRLASELGANSRLMVATRTVRLLAFSSSCDFLLPTGKGGSIQEPHTPAIPTSMNGDLRVPYTDCGVGRRGTARPWRMLQTRSHRRQPPKAADLLA
jgi:hypothetical protein